MADRRAAGLLVLSLLLSAPAFGQAAKDRPAPPSAAATTPPLLGPGDPLPRLSWQFVHGTLTATSSPVSGSRYEVTNGAVITMGDLRIEADRLTILPQFEHLEAAGHVVITRGDETLHGESFVLDGENGEFTTERALLSSPPFFLTADRLSRRDDDLYADETQISTGAAEGGELQFRASQAKITADQNLHLQNVAVSLYGVKLFTLRRLTVRLASNTNGGTGARRNSVTLPTVRNSQISGFVVGLKLPFTLRRGLTSLVDVDETTLQGLEYAVSLHQTLYSRRGARGRSPLKVRQSGPLAPNPATFGESRLRQLLTARIPAPAPDPVLEYVSITPSIDPVSQPTRTQGTDLHVEVNLWHNREVGSLRQGPVLVSRQPELVLSGTLPLTNIPVPDDDNEARSALHSVRLALIGAVEEGHYEETRLTGGRTNISDDRLGTVAGITTLPLLIGQRILMLVASTAQAYRYQTHEDYHYLETSLNADYIYATRTNIGVSYITRGLAGSTPFYFDQIDTQDEAQLRGEVRVGPSGKYTLAAIGRYDVVQRRFFDSQFALAIRGHNIEPRISYSHLNRQFTATVVLPGITSP